MKNRIPPGPGQESVWDYPRPPRLEDTRRRIQIEAGGIMIVDTRLAKRVLETSHPPVYYVPPSDIEKDTLRTSGQKTWCEWKGQAAYYDVVVGERKIRQAAWYYPNPTPAFEELKNFVAFYPSKMDRCIVDGEIAVAQAGDFYGGWITSDIVGPFKGAEGTRGW